MKKRIFTTFFLIFSLFLCGSTVVLYNLYTTTSELRYLIGLHEIEDIRQDLFLSIQKVQTYAYASNPVFNEHLDIIVASTRKMDKSIQQCNSCHHDPAIQHELAETLRMVKTFEKKLSYLITLVSNDIRRQKKQVEVVELSDSILARVQGMVRRAGKSIQAKTESTMNNLNKAYIIIGATLLSTCILALFIAGYLTRRITRPIDALVSGTRKITRGEWGYQSDFQATSEFRELIESFNKMSRSLAQTRDKEKKYVQELKETQQQLIEAEKLKSLGTLAGGIAHDFNNILCGMIGHLNILERNISPSADQLKIIQTIEHAGFRAAELIKQLLAFARQKPLEHKPVLLNDCVQQVILLLKNSFSKRIEIKVELDENIHPIQGDRSLIEQIVMNLCLNSRDAMPEGGTLTIQTDNLTLDKQFCAHQLDALPGQYVRLRIQDTGTGIDEQVLPQIFDPFYTTKEVGKGTGLGLAMVYGAVKSHAGFCEIESKTGHGTTFDIYLPVTAERERFKTMPNSQTGSITHDKKTILIVDDEEWIARMLSDYLTEQNYTTLIALNGREGVDMLNRNRDNIDLIILDINMPVMDGYEAYQEFVKIRSDIKVLVSTGYIMNNETRKILELGAQGFIHKPYKVDELDAKIRELLAE